MTCQKRPTYPGEFEWLRYITCAAVDCDCPSCDRPGLDEDA